MDLCRPAQILIYDFASLTFMRALEADSYINEMFKIMPTFGGPHYEMLCAGSENGKIHFWDVETGELITVLEEHSKHSGCTAFHPTTSGLMASCSDDNHIILWVTKDLCRSLQDEDEKWMESRRIEVKPPPINIKKG
ncbi:Dipeptidyl peptidase 2, partial [Lobosporangium transversale]